MNLTLTAALVEKALKCPNCKKPISQTEDYLADWFNFPQIGGKFINQTTRILRNEEVTLVCNNCGWRIRTNNWRDYI